MITISSDPITGLLASWNFDGNYNDVLGLHNWYPTLAGFTTSSVNAKIGQALVPNGAASMATFSVTPDVSDFTYAFWHRPISNTNVGAFFFNKIPNTQSLGFQWGANYYFYYDNGYTLFSNSGIPLNTYHLFTLTVKNGFATMYINAQKVSSLQTPGSTYSFDNFGYNGYSTFLNGEIDILSIWNRALTLEEIKIYYNNGQGIQYPFR